MTLTSRKCSPVEVVVAVMISIFAVILWTSSANPITSKSVSVIRSAAWNGASPSASAMTVNSEGSERQGRFFMEFARIVHDILNFRRAKFAISCNTCILALEMFRGMVNDNRTADNIIDVFTSLCVSLGIEEEPVCRGMLRETVDELIYVDKHMNHTAENICAFVLGPDCIQDPGYYAEFDWDVNLTPEPPYIPPAEPDPGAPKLRILHVSDVHLDRQYQEGSVASCDQPLCCHLWSTSKKPNVTLAGFWGDTTGACDMPARTIENFLQYVTNNVQYDVVYWTGDIPAHDIWNQTKEGNIDDLRYTAKLFKKYFRNTPVYPCLGNHESEPINSFPVPQVYPDYEISYLYDTLALTWKELVPRLRDFDNIRRGAYYSVTVKPGLRLISLNMNYCNNQNWWLLVDSKDPTSEIEWLIGELDKAEKNNEKVHIIGHIPPGNHDCAYVWSRNFHNVTLRYKNVITGQFYGHTHKDEYTITYDNSDPPQPVSMNNIGPSVTTFDGVNPAFRVYTVDGVHENSTYATLNHETYYMDLQKANAGSEPEWKLLYSAMDAYGLKSYSPVEWDKLVSRMAINETLFEVYRWNYFRGIDHGPCDAACKVDFLCYIRRAWSGADCRTKR